MILKLRPVHSHENGPAWTFPGRPAVAAHRALAGFRGGSGRARQTGRGHAGWRARRMTGNHRRSSGPGIAAGSLLHGVVTSLGWDFCGMGFLRDGISAGWDLGGMGSRRDGISAGWDLGGMGSRRDGISAGWDLGGMGSRRDGISGMGSGWDLGGMGSRRDGISAGWDLGGMGSRRPRLGSPRFVVTCSFRENHRSIPRVRRQWSDFALPISSRQF